MSDRGQVPWHRILNKRHFSTKLSGSDFYVPDKCACISDESGDEGNNQIKIHYFLYFQHSGINTQLQELNVKSSGQTDLLIKHLSAIYRSWAFQPSTFLWFDI